MLLLLAAALAGAAEPQIVLIPEGSRISVPETPSAPASTVAVEGTSFLLPEPHYDRCLTNSANLPVCQDALTLCTEQSTWAISQARETFALAKDQFGADAALVEDLRQQVTMLEAENILWEDRVKTLRNQRALAWGITGGLVLGAVTAGAVAIGN